MSARALLLAATLLLAPAGAGADEPASQPDGSGAKAATAMSAAAAAGAAEGERAGRGIREEASRQESWLEGPRQRFLLEHAPGLLAPGPKGLSGWQWVALPLLALLALGIGLLLSWLTRAVLRPVVTRTLVAWDDALLERVRGPVALFWAIVALYFLAPALDLTGPAQVFLRRGIRAGSFIAFFWTLLRTVDMAAVVLASTPWAKVQPSAVAALPLAVRIAKVTVVPVGVVAVLSELGYPVASLIAGLGIGGLALALAAQKTVENLFGSISIGVDQPFRIGDFVKIEEGTMGTVEVIGLRSTRIRTLDRTLVTIPNGKLADMKVETYAARDRIRLALTIGLVQSTSAEQLDRILKGLEAALRAHPKIWPDEVVVVFTGFGQWSLDVEVMAWLQTQDFGEFRGLRQELLLKFLEVIEQAGSALAYPTRTIHTAPQRGQPAEQGQRSQEPEQPLPARAEPR